MISFPNCKINLGLNIIRKRKDGYHDLETVFYPIDLKDIIEVVENSTGSPDHAVEFSTSGLQIPGDAGDNLCLKACSLLRYHFPGIPAIKMHLHKSIPMGAGLGGGSADGAFVLQLLNEKFSLSLTEKKLAELALQLGSDCSFFIVNRPCFASGRGEILEPINLDLSSYSFIIINPGIHIPTARAFSAINPSTPSHSIKKIITQDPGTWKSQLINDFEESVFIQFPELRDIKKELYKVGAIYSSMTGSGSSFFGIFPKNQFPVLELDRNYKIYHVI